MRWLGLLFAVSPLLTTQFAWAKDSCPPGCGQITGTIPASFHSLPSPTEIINRYIDNARNDRRNHPQIIYPVKVTVHHVGDGPEETGTAHATRTINPDGSISWSDPTWEKPVSMAMSWSLKHIFIAKEQDHSQVAATAYNAHQDPPGAITCDNYNFEFKNVVTDSGGHITGYLFHITERDQAFAQSNHKDFFVKEDLVIDANHFRELSAQGNPVQEDGRLKNASFAREFTFQGELRLDSHAVLSSDVHIGGLEGLAISKAHPNGTWTYALDYGTPQISR